MTAACNSFKVELLQAVHNFTASTGDTFKMALYSPSASLSVDTTAYSTTNEASGPGYSAGGVTLTNVTPVLDDGVAVADFSDAVFSAVTITLRFALIYNASKANRAVAVIDLGQTYTVSGGDLLIAMPPATSTNAIIRVT